MCYIALCCQVVCKDFGKYHVPVCTQPKMGFQPVRYVKQLDNILLYKVYINVGHFCQGDSLSYTLIKCYLMLRRSFELQLLCNFYTAAEDWNVYVIVYTYSKIRQNFSNSEYGCVGVLTVQYSQDWNACVCIYGCVCGSLNSKTHPV